MGGKLALCALVVRWIYKLIYASHSTVRRDSRVRQFLNVVTAHICVLRVAAHQPNKTHNGGVLVHAKCPSSHECGLTHWTCYMPSLTTTIFLAFHYITSTIVRIVCLLYVSIWTPFLSLLLLLLLPFALLLCIIKYNNTYLAWIGPSFTFYHSLYLPFP